MFACSSRRPFLLTLIAVSLLLPFEVLNAQSLDDMLSKPALSSPKSQCEQVAETVTQDMLLFRLNVIQNSIITKMYLPSFDISCHCWKALRVPGGPKSGPQHEFRIVVHIRDFAPDRFDARSWAMQLLDESLTTLERQLSSSLWGARDLGSLKEEERLREAKVMERVVKEYVENTSTVVSGGYVYWKTPLPPHQSLWLEFKGHKLVNDQSSSTKTPQIEIPDIVK